MCSMASGAIRLAFKRLSKDSPNPTTHKPANQSGARARPGRARQVGEIGLVQASEASALAFMAAAIRARNVREGDSVRIFVGIIRRGLWQHITQAEEDEARRALARYREGDQGRFRVLERRAA